MTEDQRQPSESTLAFAQLFGEAASLTFNIDCLQRLLVDMTVSDEPVIKQMMNNWLVLSSSPNPDIPAQLGWHLEYGVSVFKALRIELLLKALLITEGKAFPKTHDLLDLFELLYFKTKQQLNDLLRKAQDQRQQHAPPVIRMPNFRSIMEKHRDDFVAIRYGEPAERRHARLRDGMMNLDSATDALHNVCVHTREGAAWLENIDYGLGQHL